MTVLVGKSEEAGAPMPAPPKLYLLSHLAAWPVSLELKSIILELFFSEAVTMTPPRPHDATIPWLYRYAQMNTESLSSLNEFDELPDHIRDGMAQIHARLNKWKCLEELTVVNEYINGHTGILVYLDRAPRPPAPHTGATIWPHAKRAICHFHEGCPSWVCDFDMTNSCNSYDRSNDGMFVSIIEPLQVVEFLSRPTWICRESDKEFLRVVEGCFYSLTRGFVFPLIATERKCDFAVLCTAVNSNQFPCSMIKGGAEIVNRISQDERQIGGRCLAEANLEGLCASLRIIVDAKRMGVCL